MKIISLILCLCLSMNVLAASGHSLELENVFDDYTYAMTVEWDQHDADFKANQTRVLFDQLSNLMHSGLTSQDIQNFIESRTVLAPQAELALMANESTSINDLISKFDNHSFSFYNAGASWTGTEKLTGTLVVAFSALFVFGVYFSIKNCGGTQRLDHGERTSMCNN